MHVQFTRTVILGIALATLGCQHSATPQTPAETASRTAALNAQNAPRAQQPQIDVASLPDTAITPYLIGDEDFMRADIMPLFASSNGYSQKWEFILYTKPYEARLKFEINNLAFSKFEGKARGYVKHYHPDGTDTEYSIAEVYKNGQYTLEKDRLAMQFGPYSLELKGKTFHIKGVFEKGAFEYDIPIHPWKPGTGNVYFGNDSSKVFKYSVLTYHKPVLRGVFNIDGQTVPVTGQAYGNHYATALPVYDMFDEVADFRNRTDDLLVEFRYYVPSQKYDAKPFGFFFAAYQGEPVFESTQITRTTLDTWLDDGNYNYEIDARQRIEATSGNNHAVFEMLTAAPTSKDFYDGLPAFQRNIAMRFAKPIEYNINIDWTLDLDVDGMRAIIPSSGRYCLTRLR